MFKRLLALGAVSVAVVWMIAWLGVAFGVGSPLFAFLANWVAMSWMAVAGQFVHFSLPRFWSEHREWEGDGRNYELVGIRAFKALVRRGPLTVLSPTLRMPREVSVASLHALEAEMHKAEAGHVIALIIGLALAAWLLLLGLPAATAWLLLFNLLLNGYPIMLQRYNRIKLRQRIARLAAGA